MSSAQALEDKIAALNARMEEKYVCHRFWCYSLSHADHRNRFQFLDSRLRVLEADTRVTQEGLKACMEEIGGALDFLRTRVGGDRKDMGDRLSE